MATDMGISEETKNTTSPISSRRSTKSTTRVSMIDSFTRETFRRNMIEKGRTEDLSRQMGYLADEDHTHHLTPQEYYHYKSIWWLHSNKTGSNTCKENIS